MKRFSPFALVLFTLFAILSPASAAVITDYRAASFPCLVGGRSAVAIREFLRDGKPCLVVVDPARLTTMVVSRGDAVARDGGFAESTYRRAVTRYGSGPHRLQNDGMVRGEREPDGVFLTVDLCPSSRAFEKGLFEAAERLSPGKPAPVAVAITGNWLDRHPQEFAWLVGEEKGGRLAITWVNHSHNHPYQPGAPFEKTFLLTAGTDFDSEIFRVERMLLERGQVPSIFFRFPGLVSDATLVGRLRQLGLIPLGADAWLAKGEKPVKGSIILVHGNGNEPKGITLFHELVAKREGKVTLLPLNLAVEQGGDAAEQAQVKKSEKRI